jgi:transcriptional regulator with XRE-family HTH domain
VKETPADWPKSLTKLVGGRVKYYRGRQRPKLSARQLAERCEHLGYKVEYNAVANLESGRRQSISLAEVVMLAAALGVSPALLLFPIGSGEPVELLPGRTFDPFRAYELFTGDRSIWDGEFGLEDAEDAIYTYRRHDHAVEVYERNAMRDDEVYERAVSQLAEVRRTIQDKGWHLPKPPTGLNIEAEDAEIQRRNRVRAAEHRRTLDDMMRENGKGGGHDGEDE